VSEDAANKWTFVIDEDARILFVDDDVILTEFARVHLATPTTVVEYAADGEQAWARLCAEPFKLVLLDIEMPCLDGFGLLQKLRADARFVDLPVIMLTGREDIASIDKAFRLGASSFAVKPINWRQLSYEIRYVLRNKRMEEDLLKERKRSSELLQLTNNLLSLIRLEARTPLSAIIGFCDCIREQIDGPVGENYLKYAEQIDAAARQLQDNFMDLIQYAQLTSGAAQLSQEEYPAVKILDASLMGLRTGAPAGATIEVTRPEESFYVQCDLLWLTRALRHLLETVGRGAERVEFSISRSGDDGALISIRACGRDPAPASTSLESVRNGLGMGVAFARYVIELHGGVLTMDSRSSDETSMKIELPVQGARPISGSLSDIEAA
jgi:CheY-like chemotaxis protein